MKYKTLVLLAAVLLLTVMPLSAQDVTTITWINCCNWASEDIIANFEAANPDVKIELEQVDFNALFEQIQVRLGAGASDPDVLSVDVPVTAGYGLRGWLLPLDDAFTDEDRADWLPAALAAGTYNGELVSAPVSTSTQLLFVNTDMFEAAGIEVPGVDDRLTYEQVADIAAQLTQDTDGDGITDQWGFSWEQTVRIYQLQPLAVGLGGQSIGDDGLTVDGVINSQAWIDGFSYYADMFNELKAAPQDDTIGTSDLFWSGKMGMMIAGPWNINRYLREADDIDFNWTVSRHPYFEDGAITTPTGSWHIGVNASSDSPEAAKRFVKYISTGAGAERWWRFGSGDFPAQQSVLALFQTDEEFDEGVKFFLRVAADEATVNPDPRAVSPGYLEYEQILQDAFQDIRTGSDVEESLNLAVARIESEMVKYRG